ncbi:glycosyltransferase family 4 protein [Aporhodopirellula aestuarii]|uniref:Glycosyltransferase n=1 Tax=Aporhodopirellula aestuarii TaxID=2950107 RepID=A0ABT0U943_9BACT|nr:glycosyltransferase [Aporhodopirellula aestuarii]MCM2373045.1 glycosyltransferase [Aporhodopirellula aestuarii]
MKIALVIPTMDRGGAEKQVVLLAIGLHEAGHDVRVVLLTRDGPRSETLRRAGVEVVLIGKKFKLDPTALWRLTKWMKTWQPDLVHTWLFAANSFGRTAAKLAGVPVIVASERCVDPWKRGWHFFIDRYLQKITAAITTNSHGVEEFYAAHGIDENKFVVIPNGVEANSSCDLDTEIDRATALKRLEVTPGRKLILAVGRLWPQKRVRDLIWAGELLGTLRQDTTLVIIGDGPQREEMLRHRDAVSRPEHVRFAGAREDVQQLLPHADAFWIASEYEGQSNAVIEAMLAGVPVIASNIPGNRDLVIDGQTGFLFEVGDEAKLVEKTNTLLNEPDLADRVSTAAKTRIETEFAVTTMVDRHIALYQRLLNDQ